MRRWQYWRGAGCLTWAARCAWSSAPAGTWLRPVRCCHSACCWATLTRPSTPRSTGCSTDSLSSSPAVQAPSTARYGCSACRNCIATPPQLPHRLLTRPPSGHSIQNMSISGHLNIPSVSQLPTSSSSVFTYLYFRFFFTDVMYSIEFRVHKLISKIHYTE